MDDKYIAKLTIRKFSSLTFDELQMLRKWMLDKSQEINLVIEQNQQGKYCDIWNSRLIKHSILEYESNDDNVENS